MQGRLLFLKYRRLRFSVSQLSSFRRISSSSEESLSESLSVLRRERPKQSPSQDFASRFNLKLPSNPNANPVPNLQSNLDTSAENFEPKLEFHPNPNPNLVTVINSSSAVSLPEVEKCIWAVERLSKGKKYARRDKEQNRVTGYVCEQDSGQTDHVLILMDKFQIQNLLGLLGEARFLCTIFTLEVFDGLGSSNVLYRERVLPRRINYGKSGEVGNVGYIKVSPGMKVRLDVPIRINGQEDCPGLRKGGFLKVYLSYVSLLCVPEELPLHLEVDIKNMDIGDKVCVGDLRNQVPLYSDNQHPWPICEIIEVHT